MVLVAIEDLIFLSKIAETAGAVGLRIESVDLRTILDKTAGAEVQAVILDLNHRSGNAVEAIRALKANPATQTVSVVGFLSHVQTDLAAAARAAGCDQVMPRSKFAQQLPQLLRSLATTHRDDLLSR